MESMHSTTFIKKPPTVTDRDEKFLYTKELLSDRIFSGFYRERKYVAKLEEYRDVVIICPEEYELIENVDRLRKKWVKVSGIKWVGITGSDGIDIPNARCFWVKLKDLPFGHYWFLVKHVKLKEGEVILQLKCLRKAYKSEMQISPSETRKNGIQEPNLPHSANEEEIFPKLDLDIDDITSTIRTGLKKGFQITHSHLTWRNFFNLLRTTFKFLAFLVIGLICFMGNFGEFILKLLRELTLFMQAFSPIVVQVIDFLTKVVGAVFILIAGTFGGNRDPRRNQDFNRAFAEQAQANWKERNERLRRELFLNSGNR